MNEKIKMSVLPASSLILSKVSVGWWRVRLRRAWVWNHVNWDCHCICLVLLLTCWASEPFIKGASVSDTNNPQGCCED